MEARTIRVFISSTFRDLEAERDYLNKIVFPQVEQYCTQRFLTFIPIDLRWGIPEEDSRNGLVLSTCLEEIDYSRPFFIGILGSRYGWMPKPEELNNLRSGAQPFREWLDKKVSEEVSITELEMEYGVLRDMNLPYASFFIRSDEMEVSSELREEPGSIAERKLNKLKQRIRSQQKYPVMEYYSVEQFGKAVFDQLIKMIEAEYPIKGDDESNSVIERQERILQNRSKSLFDMSQTLEQFVNLLKGHNKVLIINGPPSSGTSTILAYCVTELRKRYASKIIYFDFETVEEGVDCLKAFFSFVSLEENRIPSNQWGMIAIDNSSMLSAENGQEFTDWIDRLGKNVYLAIDASDSDLYWTLRYRYRCSGINVRDLPIDLKREYIDNYVKQFGKRLSPQQLDALVEKNKSKTVGNIELLLRLLVNFGSFEQLDNRIAELVKNFDDFWAFNPVFDTAKEAFSIVKLDQQYTRAIVYLSLTSYGLPEKDLIELTGLSQAEWSIIRPSVLVFCKGNANRLSFSVVDWQLHARDFLTSTVDRCWFGMQMVNWYLSNPQKWSSCAKIISAICAEIWYLPYEGYEKERQSFTESIFSFVKSPDMIKQLNNFEIDSLEHILMKKDLSDSPFCTYGRSIENLPPEEAIAYYQRMAKLMSAMCRGKDAAYCYSEIVKIKEKLNHVDVDLYRSKSCCEEGRPDMGAFVIGFSNMIKGKRKKFLLFGKTIEYTIEQQSLAIIQRFKADFMRGDLQHAAKMIELFRDTVNPFLMSSSKELQIIIFEGYATFAYVLCGIYHYGNHQMAQEFLAVLEKLPSRLALGHEFNYLRFMAETCLYYKNKSYETMLKSAKWLEVSAHYAYGDGSYQYARAHLMYNFAHYQVCGKYGEDNFFTSVNKYNLGGPRNAYGRSFERHTLRNIDWSKIELGVKNTLLQEYEFFWNMEYSIQPDFWAQELDKNKEEYRKSIGL